MGHDFEALSGQIIEAAIAVHTKLGPGFLESIYENAMKIALADRGISYESQCEVPIMFEGTRVGVHRLDLVVGEEIIVELKAVEAILPIHEQQVLSYLKSTGLRLGLLINFNIELLKKGIRRFVN